MNRHGIFDIQVIRNGQIRATYRVNNLITNEALDREIKILTGETVNLRIAYFAIGSGNSTPYGTNTKLDSEFYRVVPDEGPEWTDTGKIQTSFTVPASGVSGTIAEIGVFAGSTATSATDSGILISRTLWNFVKTTDDLIVVNRIDEVKR